SSRRRHTRSKRDWSSDVCSSDLTLARDYESVSSITEWAQRLPENCFFQSHRSFIVNFEHVSDFDHTLIHLCSRQYSEYLTRRKRSEERRVGKECKRCMSASGYMV